MVSLQRVIPTFIRRYFSRFLFRSLNFAIPGSGSAFGAIGPYAACAAPSRGIAFRQRTYRRMPIRRLLCQQGAENDQYVYN